MKKFIFCLAAAFCVLSLAAADIHGQRLISLKALCPKQEGEEFPLGEALHFLLQEVGGAGTVGAYGHNGTSLVFSLLQVYHECVQFARGFWQKRRKNRFSGERKGREVAIVYDISVCCSRTVHNCVIKCKKIFRCRGYLYNNYIK